MNRRRGWRITVVLIVIVVLGYMGRLAVAASERGKPAGSTTTRPVGSVSLPPVTTGISHKHAVRHLMKDAYISPEGLPLRDVDSLLNIAQAARVGVVSTGVNWADIEPNGPGGSAGWAILDAFAKDVLHRKMKLRFQLQGFPDWARDPGQPNIAAAPWLPPVAPDELARWKRFVGEVARHFRGRVTYYEIWNEPNISPFFYPLPDPAEYADLLEASYTTIKAIDRSALVVFAGMSGNDVGFLDRVYDAMDADFGSLAKRDHHFFDILGVHPYSGSRSPTSVLALQRFPDDFGIMNDNFLGFEELHATMAAHGEGYKTIYITEYGFTTYGFYGFPPISDATRASYLRQAFSLVDRIPYVIGFSWYCLYANAGTLPGWALLQGSYPEWQPTATFEAWKAVH